jgi:very-short-patch-repair endonuclease
VIEIDGDSHFTPHGETYDLLRTEDLESLGLRVIRLTNTEVMQQFDAVCGTVLQALG